MDRYNMYDLSTLDEGTVTELQELWVMSSDWHYVDFSEWATMLYNFTQLPFEDQVALKLLGNGNGND